MTTARINGVQLYYEQSGTGEIPLVLVHGSWASHHTWDRVAPRLAESFSVVTYDRRGHSESERTVGQGSVHEDVADLAGLIDHLGLAPAYVAGNSFGASITCRLAAQRPALLAGLIAHEPPLLGLLGDDPSLAPLLAAVSGRVGAVVERIAAGDHHAAAEQFVETVALGPGAWASFPPDVQQAMVDNAPTFLDEGNDPEALTFELGSVRSFPHPALLTTGDQSPPFFAPIVAMLAAALPVAEVVSFAGAGHTPQESHPGAYAETVTAFIRRHQG